MRKAHRLFLYTIGLVITISAIGCGDIDTTGTSDQTGEQGWFSVIDEWKKNADLSPEEEALLRERIETAIRINKEGMPDEITQAWNQMKEDYKEFLGVKELPKREIAPGTYSWIPEEYLEGEKHEKLYDFLSDRFKNLNQLNQKHGLQEPTKLRKSENQKDILPAHF